MIKCKKPHTRYIQKCLSQYEKVYFIGDSHTWLMFEYAISLLPGFNTRSHPWDYKNVYYIHERLTDTFYDSLKRILKNIKCRHYVLVNHATKEQHRTVKYTLLLGSGAHTTAFKKQGLAETIVIMQNMFRYLEHWRLKNNHLWQNLNIVWTTMPPFPDRPDFIHVDNQNNYNRAVLNHYVTSILPKLGIKILDVYSMINARYNDVAEVVHYFQYKAKSHKPVTSKIGFDVPHRLLHMICGE